MSDRSRRIPKYRHYKPKDLGVVRLDGRDHYLGKYDSPESWEKYHRLIAEWLGNGHSNQRKPSPGVTGGNGVDLSVNRVLVLYWQFARDYYVKDGKPAKELASMREALRPVKLLYGHTAATDFGPKALKLVRQHMVEQGLSRGVVNHHVSRVKRVFKWAVAEELISAPVFHGLQAVSGLRYGRTTARESEPVEPATDEQVNAVLPFLPPPVVAMISLQRLTGMRSCEVVIMRPCDLDRSAEVWIYEPADHKNRWRGNRKLIPLGPLAQEVITPFLDRPATSFLFSPRESDAWRRQHRPVYFKANRKTPVYPSELKARKKAKLARRKRKSKRPKRDHYDTDSYRRAIIYGFEKARKAGVEIDHWHPHQLRHTRGTEIRREYGIEAAQVLLGHARADVTQIYAQKNLELAIRIAKECG